MANFLTQKLIQIVNIFKKNHVDYCVTGGLAYSALVEPRATIDIDICILTMKNDLVGELLKQNFGNIFIHAKPMVFGNIKIQRYVIIEKENEIIVDILLDNSEKKYFEQILNNSIDIEIFGDSIRIISPDDLIILKELSNRPQDIIDFENLRKTFKEQLNNKYIENWLEILGK